MKTSKLLITSLLAAAAMGTNAFGALLETITADPGSSVTKTITSGDEIDLNFGSNGVPVTCAFELSGEDGTFTIGAPQGWKTYILEGAITGSGTLTLKGGTVGGYAFGWALNNDMSGFSGKIKLENSKGGINQLKLRGSNGTSFSNIEVDLTKKNGNTQKNILLVETTATIKGISGTSTDAYVLSNGAQTLTLNTAGSDFSFSGAVGTGVQFATDSSSTPNTNAGTLSLVKTGLGTQTFTGTVSLGSLTVEGGELVLSGTANIAGTTTVTGGTLDLSGGTITLANAIQNSGTVTISDTTVFNLTQTGATTLINGGTIAGVDWSSLTKSNFTYNGAALARSTVNVSTAGAVTLDYVIANLTWTGSASTTWDEGRSQNWTNASTSAADVFYNYDSVTFDASTTGTTNIAAGVTVTNLTISGGTHTFTRPNNGSGYVVVTGTATVQDGATLDLGAETGGKGLLRGTITVQSGGTLRFSKKDVTGYDGGDNSLKTITVESGGRLELAYSSNNNNNETFAGTLNLNGTLAGTGSSIAASWHMFKDNSEIVVAAGSNALIDENITLVIRRNNAPITVNADATLTVNGEVLKAVGHETSWNGVLVKNGAGKLTLNGNVNVTGVTQNAGTLTIGGAATIGTLTQSAGTLNVTAGTTTVGTYGGLRGQSVEGALTIAAGASMSVTGGMTLRWQNENTTTLNVNGDLSVGGNLWISRDGKGIVNINEGGTVVANTLTFGQHWDDSTGENKTSQVNVATGGKLIAGSIVANTNLNDSTKTSILASSALNLNGGTLGTSADSMTIDVTSGNTALSVKLGPGTTSTINTGKYDTATKTFTNTEAAISIANVISGDGALKKAGAGTLTLRGANTYKGGTTIEGGVLVAGHASALGTKGVEVKSGATLNLGTSAVTVAGLSGAGAVGLAEGTTSSTLTVTGGGVFSGTLSGGQNSLALVFDAEGQTLELNPKFGNLLSSVEVKAGTVKTGNALGLGYSANVTVQSLGTLEFTTSNLTTKDSGLTLVNGGITFKNGASFVVDVTGAATDVALSIITSSVIKFYNGSEDVSLTSENLDQFVDNFVKLKGWDGLADWAYDGSKLSLTMTIPEPSVFGLLAGLGALALAGTRRRRKKA